MRLPTPHDATVRRAAAAGLALLAGLAGPAMGANAPVAKPSKTVASPIVMPAPLPSINGLCSRIDIAPVLHIPVGKSTVMRPRSPVTRILLGNPENARAARPGESPDDPKKDEDGKAQDARKKDDSVKAPVVASRPGVADVDVLLLAPTEIFLLGKSIGSTNVVMLDRTGVCTAFDVVVGMDVTALQSVLARLLPAEKTITITPAFDSIVLSGVVSDSEALTRVTDLTNAYLRGGDGGSARNPRIVNMLEVGAPQQVMLEVKVAEVSKALMDQFGIDFSRAYVPGDGSMMRFLSGIFGGGAGIMGQISNTGPNGVPFSSVDAVVGGTVQGVPGVAGGNVTVTYDPQGRPIFTTTYGTVPGRGASNLTAQMQKTDGLVRVLAEPTVMAISGQTGSFLAGGKIFIPVSQSNSNGGRDVTLEEKEFGVSVKFTPTVLGNGLINLRVRPEVSELNAQGVTISGLGNLTAVLPSFTSRKAETTVQLMDGQSFAIGGLIKNNTTTNIKAFPFLGELPVVGALFRSTEFQTDRSELVFVITPRLVKPLPLGYRLPTDNYTPPTRQELILDGKTEGKRVDPPLAGQPVTTPEPMPAAGGFDKGTK